MSKKLCLVFDLDGTLSDTLPDLVLAVNRMRVRFELPQLDDQKVASYVGNGFEKLLERSLQGTDVTVNEGRPVLMETYRDSLNESGRLFPDVFNGLRELKNAGCRIALLSNKPEDFCKFILFDAGIGSEFDLIFGGGEEYPLKPDPAPLFAVMELLNGTKENTWMIGDSVTDLETGRRAGVNRGFVTWGYGKPGTEIPTKTFDSFADLTGFFVSEAKK